MDKDKLIAIGALAIIAYSTFQLRKIIERQADYIDMLEQTNYGIVSYLLTRQEQEK